MQTVDDILLDAGADIKRVFNAERLHIYVISDDGRLLHSKVRAADGTVSDFRRPIKNSTLVGVVAQTQTEVNLRDATDPDELGAVHADLQPGGAFGIEAGDAPQQVLVAPILYRGKRGQGSEMLGVAQLINSRSGQPFGSGEMEGFRELCDTLAVAIHNRRKEADLASLSARPVRSKYDALVADGLISAEEIKLAANSARRKSVDVEEILLTEFQVDRRAIGKALSTFFDVPYEPFKPDRPKPLELCQQIKREYAQSAQWVPVEDANEGLVVLTTDPERIQSSRVVSNIFPRATKVVYRVTTAEEFQRTLDLFFGEDIAARIDQRLPARRRRRRSARVRRAQRRSGRRRGQRAGQVRQQGDHRRASPGRVGHPHRAVSGSPEDRDPLSQGRHARAVRRGAAELPRAADRADQDHVRPRHLREAEAAGREDQVQEVRAARHRAARRDDPVGRWRRGRRDADPVRRQADPGRAARPHAAQPRRGCCRSSRSPTASSSSAGRPARARRRRCIRSSAASTRPRPRSGPPRIRSRSRRRGCARSRSTARQASISRPS